MSDIEPSRVPCPECGEAILPGARRCPHCQAKFRTRGEQLVIVLVIALLTVGAVSWWWSRESDDAERKAEDRADCIVAGGDVDDCF